MKKILALSGLALLASLARSAEPVSPVASESTGRVGLYDSRVLAYAHFWSEAGVRERSELVARAKAAKTAGDTAGEQSLKRQIAALQKRSHLQVFSTAPADEAMAVLKPRLPLLQRELGVSRFISKWDAAALREVAEPNRVDVTERLMRELFTPNERQRRTIEAMKSAEPLPLDRAKIMVEAGEL